MWIRSDYFAHDVPALISKHKRRTVCQIIADIRHTLSTAFDTIRHVTYKSSTGICTVLLTLSLQFESPNPFIISVPLVALFCIRSEVQHTRATVLRNNGMHLLFLCGRSSKK